MDRKALLLAGLTIFLIASVTLYKLSPSLFPKNIVRTNQNTQENQGGPKTELDPLTIEALKKAEYPGSNIVIEQTLDPGSNYQRYISSYKSEVFKIYDLLTIH